jgi:hypothetical protein
MPKSELLRELLVGGQPGMNKFTAEVERRRNMLIGVQKIREGVEMNSRIRDGRQKQQKVVQEFKNKVEDAKNELKLAGLKIEQLKKQSESQPKTWAEPTTDQEKLISIVKFDLAIKNISLTEWIQRKDEVQKVSTNLIKQAIEYYDSVKPPEIAQNSEGALFNRVDFMSSDHYMEKLLGLIKDPLVLDRRRRRWCDDWQKFRT